MSNELITVNGQGRTYDCAPNWQMTFLVPRETATPYDFAQSEMGYLGGPPLHIHPEQDETHYVVQGKLRYQIGEILVEVNSGDCVHIPKGTPHAWINLQQEPARIIAVLNPGHSEGFFLTLTSSPTPLAPEALIELGRKYGSEVVGPPMAVDLLP